MDSKNEKEKEMKEEYIQAMQRHLKKKILEKNYNTKDFMQFF